VEQEFQFGRQVLGVLVLRRRVAEGPPVGRSAAEGPLGKGEEGEFGADRRVPVERESPEVSYPSRDAVAAAQPGELVG
jgi:hypothetical protein